MSLLKHLDEIGICVEESSVFSALRSVEAVCTSVDNVRQRLWRLVVEEVWMSFWRGVLQGFVERIVDFSIAIEGFGDGVWLDLAGGPLLGGCFCVEVVVVARDAK